MLSKCRVTVVKRRHAIRWACRRANDLKGQAKIEQMLKEGANRDACLLEEMDQDLEEMQRLVQSASRSQVSE